MVFRGAGDGLIVLSPGCKLPPAALDELSEFGKVAALVANNAAHWMGQPEWTRRFPDVKHFAPKDAVEKLQKHLPDLPSFEPVSAAAPLLGGRAKLFEGEGFKPGWGNVFASVVGSEGPYWYASDLLANLDRLPHHPLYWLIMKATTSGPGFQLFRPAVWLQVGDKASFRAWADAALARDVPTTIVPAHGRPARGDIAESARRLFAKA